MSETKKAKALNVPNALSILRMILVPFFVWAVLAMDMTTLWGRIVPAVIFAVTAFTDCLDGQIARRCNLITNFGKFLDPLADKFMVFAALVVMVYRYTYLSPWLVWATVLIMFRELAVTSLRLVAAGQAGHVIAASFLGKLKTVSQILGILVIILEPLLWPVYGSEINPLSYVMMAMMVLTTMVSGWDYLKAYLPVLDLNA
ncbi:MAG: CDP-diacylglycerol--glycerol-3-phosphate 3-phosphatidyltransferase [Clostridia bacterium]|nr:CDP-diacylglycerol--glycerol-3-phosphate 3-phosphatidyltransferase [Clostridia bacterium]